MPELVTILKGLCSGSALAGLGMTCMSLGVIPVDEGLEGVAQVFIGDMIPTRLFLGILGPAKLLGVASLWGYGPLPKTVGLVGLAMSAFCGAIGHGVRNETAQMLIAGGSLAMFGAVHVLEQKKAEGKKE